jgi:hypothetical protein
LTKKDRKMTKRAKLETEIERSRNLSDWSKLRKYSQNRFLLSHVRFANSRAYMMCINNDARQ